MAAKTKRRGRQRSAHQGKGLDIQMILGKTEIEYDWPGFQYNMGPVTQLKKKTGESGDQTYWSFSLTTRLQSSPEFSGQTKGRPQKLMIGAIERLPVKKTLTPNMSSKIFMKTKQWLDIDTVLPVRHHHQKLGVYKEEWPQGLDNVRDTKMVLTSSCGT